MKKIEKSLLLTASIVFILGLISCSKKQTETAAVNTVSVEITKSNHAWYYFTTTGYKETDKPQNAPFQASKPWTEAIRISSSGNSAENPENCYAFAIVNRLGMISFNGDNVTLSPDVSLFTDRTAGNLVFQNNSPIFSVYKSSFFNDTIVDPDYKANQSAHIFLVQFDPLSKISFPLISCTNITDKPNSEVTDFYWNGLEWCCSIKTISDTKNEFSYVRFKPLTSLLSLSPATASEQLSVSETTAEFFRSTKEQLDYTNAPERIKKLLAGFDKKLPFIIEVKNAGGSSPRIYANDISDSKAKELNATAILSQSWSAALFEDGTLFLEGALPGKHILRSGMPVAIRLPRLPKGYVYSDFVISGTTLYAAWEETSFYQTGRSGFLQVNLDRTLYSRLL